MKFSYLLAIILLSGFLRLYSLGSNPPSLDWDEASLAYNAYSLLRTGADEYGNKWPLSIRSFNDYKPPLYSYLTIPSIALFGLTEFATRLPSALMGIVGVIAIYYLTQNLFQTSKSSPTIGLISAFLLAISPWHLQFSRAAFEANLALNLYLLSLTFFCIWRSPANQTQKKYRRLFLFLSALSAILTLYSYHSARLVVPIAFVSLAILNYQTIKTHAKQVVLALTIAIIIASPLLLILLRGSATNRFNSVSVFTNPGEFSRERERIERAKIYKSQDTNIFSLLHTNKSTLATIVARNYFEHFNFEFLFLRADGNPRHRADGMGLLYLVNFPFLLYGAFKLANSKHPKHVVWIILLTGPLAASLTASTPHAIRSMLMLPALIILTAYGWHQFMANSASKSFLKLIPITLLFLNLLYYLNLYYTVTPVQFSRDWQYGYKRLVDVVNDTRADYDEVIVTTKYDQPHIYFAFYGPIDPKYYQSFANTVSVQIHNIYFRDIQESDFQLQNTLIAAEPDKTPANANIIHQIKFLNGEIAFNLISTK